MIIKLIKKVIRKLIFLINPVFYARRLGVDIGFNCRIATDKFGSEPYLIKIGNNCSITRGVTFVNHDGGVWIFRKDNENFDIFGKIVIGNNVYIGNETTILPGVTIGDNCVIGASSVVTKSIPSNTVAAGAPIRYICKTEEYFNKTKEKNINTKGKKDKKKIILENIDEKGIIKGELNPKK
ncbi:MAG: acyltransferase [Lunatimonas sp.]|uniref:acyltransferase n=1 Tax=Lunatimonas sp. TaxID=2060141 RepID=UPI00263AC17E|nr:acyltransferase [Lunatimonas sp.]MCC5936789.1 acyltransferase [Lunatimonas sp.]